MSDWINDDEVIRPETVATRRVYSEKEYNKLWVAHARLTVWLREISDMDPSKLYTGYDAVRAAKSALQEAGDEQ